MIQQRRVVTLPAGLMSVRTFAPAAAAIPAWYVVAGKTCVAAYLAKGAASLAASYVNLANPGTYDAAPGVAPTWDAGTGWTFSGPEYLTTGVVIGAGYTFIARFIWNANDARRVIGANDAGFAGIVGLVPVANSAGATQREFDVAGTQSLVIPRVVSGTYGVAGLKEYPNGVPGSTVAAVAYATNAIYIGALNNNGGAGFGWDGSIQALAVYSGTLSDAEMAALHAAMMAL